MSGNHQTTQALFHHSYAQWRITNAGKRKPCPDCPGDFTPTGPRHVRCTKCAGEKVARDRRARYQKRKAAESIRKVGLDGGGTSDMVNSNTASDTAKRKR